MDSQPSTLHLSFMATLAGQIANFFHSVTEVCLNELHGKISKPAPQISVVCPNTSTKSATVNGLDHQPEARQAEVEKSSDDRVDTEKCEQKKKKGRPRNKTQIVSHKPKAPTSSYLLFFHDSKQAIAAKLGLTSSSDITRAASEEWKKLGEAEKAKYIKRSEEEQVRYHQAMKIYKLQYAEEIKLKRLHKQKTVVSQAKTKKVKKRQELEISSGSDSSSSNSSISSVSSQVKKNISGTVISIDDSNNSSVGEGDNALDQ